MNGIARNAVFEPRPLGESGDDMGGWSSASFQSGGSAHESGETRRCCAGRLRVGVGVSNCA